VADVPMDAAYGDETSNLKISRIIGEFMAKHLRNFGKRVFYNYFLRDMTAATLELVVGVALLSFGVVFGTIHWARALSHAVPTPLGTIMLAALPVLIGLQLILAFVNYDVANVPTRPIGKYLPPNVNGKSS
jgi:hypothetical protein